MKRTFQPARLGAKGANGSAVRRPMIRPEGGAMTDRKPYVEVGAKEPKNGDPKMYSALSSPASYMSTTGGADQENSNSTRFGRFKKWLGEHKTLVAVGVATVSAASIGVVMMYKPDLVGLSNNSSGQGDSKQSKWSYSWKFTIPTVRVKVAEPAAGSN